jgi:long-chain acyl-CoA synthetase
MIWDFKQFKDNVAILTEGGEKITYSGLISHASTLQAKVEKRSLIIQMCKNDFGSLLGYTTFVNSHAVPILLKESMASETLQLFIDRYQPNYIYLPADQRAALSSFEEIYSNFDYCLLKTKYATNPMKLNKDLALLLTTSGSTGSPKLVRLSYQNLRSNTESIVDYLKITESDRAMTSLPMNYTYGLSVINSHLYAGSSILLSSKTIMQKEFWTQLREFAITTLSGVPYTYDMLDKLRFLKMDLPALKILTQAGGKLSLKLHEKFANWARESGKQFVVMYGQTEATARMSYLPNNQSVEKAGSIGIAIPGGKFELIDDNGNEITTADTVGELVYKGQNVSLGYADSIDSLALGDEFASRLCTGDMAKKDKDGYFYIVGRKKRFLKIFGNRVNLDETEHLIKDKFLISDCACAGYDDKMFVFICDPSLQDQILSYVTQLTALHPSAFKFVTLETIPKNDAGKALYQELEQYYV